MDCVYYVGKAIESILAQTLTDWEFFCVDDGTKDKSGEICDEYAKKDPRIIVIHKENGGAPSARNVAIDKAKGKCEVIITGRNPAGRLMDRADYITDMKCVRHPYDKGITARLGIEY